MSEDVLQVTLHTMQSYSARLMHGHLLMEDEAMAYHAMCFAVKRYFQLMNLAFEKEINRHEKENNDDDPGNPVPVSPTPT